ncbi:hypothetical protein O9992_15795 [Vibrio lentus]|nr:hypothetical protein [Vibrio lentus]
MRPESLYASPMGEIEETPQNSQRLSRQRKRPAYEQPSEFESVSMADDNTEQLNSLADQQDNSEFAQSAEQAQRASC